MLRSVRLLCSHCGIYRFEWVLHLPASLIFTAGPQTGIPFQVIILSFPSDYFCLEAGMESAAGSVTELDASLAALKRCTQNLATDPLTASLCTNGALNCSTTLVHTNSRDLAQLFFYIA